MQMLPSDSLIKGVQPVEGFLGEFVPFRLELDSWMLA